MKYDAPATAASVARGITRSDVRKILTGLPRENILLRASKRCGKSTLCAWNLLSILLRIGAHRVGHSAREKLYCALISKLVRTDTSCEPNNSYRLFNFFSSSRKIHFRIIALLTAVIMRNSCR